MANSTSTVSVILRTKDRPTLLPRALSSIAAQTYRAIELIIVNDGGQAEVISDALAEVALRDIRVVELHNDQAHGRAGALNDGFAAADGKYLVIHDDDDTWEPEFLDMTTAFLETHPKHSAVAAATWVVNETVAEGKITEISRERLAADLCEINLIDMSRHNAMPPIATLIRAEAAYAAGTFDPTLDTLEDWDFFLRLMQQGPFGYLADAPLAKWHHRKDATGALGNSIFVDAESHRSNDKAVRERHIRSGSPLGAVLASAAYANDLTELVDRRLDALVRHLEMMDARQNELMAAIELHLSERMDRRVMDLARQLESIGQDAQWARLHIAGLEDQFARRTGNGLRRVINGVARRIDPVKLPHEQVHTARATEAAASGDPVVLPEPEVIPSHEHRWLDEPAMPSDSTDVTEK